MLDLIAFYFILTLIGWLVFNAAVDHEVRRRLRRCGLDRSMSHTELQDAIDHTYGHGSAAKTLFPDSEHCQTHHQQ